MIKVIKGFPSVMLDNQQVYIGYLEGVIESIDYQASMSIIKSIDHLVVRIVPSATGFINRIVEEINTLHHKFGIIIEYSKSIKSSGSICFKIDWED